MSFLKNIKTATDLLQEKKDAKLADIKRQVNTTFENGVCELSLGWSIDCRRSANQNDISNIEGLIKLSPNDTDVISVKGADNQFHNVTVAELRDVVIPEMYVYGFSLYQRKWIAEEALKVAVTEAEIASVTF